MSPRARARRSLSFVVGSDRGRRSRAWSVSVGRNGTGSRPGVVLGVEHDLSDPQPVHTVLRAGWAVALPRRLTVDAGSAAACLLGSSVLSPAPGWDVGALLVVPQTALSVPAGTALPAGCRQVPAPPPGHHVQIVLLVGKPDAITLNLMPDRDAGALETDRGRLRLWSHVVPTGPGAFGPRSAEGDAREDSVGRIPLVVDPGWPCPAVGRGLDHRSVEP